MRSYRLISALLIVGAAVLGGSSTALAQGADASVSIIDFDYDPASITIKAGQSVTWTQDGDEPHTVTADSGAFDSGQMQTGTTFSMRFDEAGTFPYYCTLHGAAGGQGMSGVVVVEGGQVKPPKEDEPKKKESREKKEPKEDDEGTAPAPTPTGGAGAERKGSLPRTGSEPPAVWIFAIGLVLTGLVFWRVTRMAARAENR